MRLLLIMRLLLFTIGLKLSRGYYNRGGYYPSAVTITGNTVLSKTKGYKHIFSFSHSTLFSLKKTQYIKKPDKSPYNFGEKYKRLLNLFSNSAGN